MKNLNINNLEFVVKDDITVLEACKYVGITVPRFCYHEILSIPANCRMCLVEIDEEDKPFAACMFPVDECDFVSTESPFVIKARENVVETLLVNHPLDCPICDQAGECDLQDQTKVFGNDYSKFFLNKRGVEDKYCGPLIKTIMTRCIHCTRCVRFGSEVAGIEFLGTLSRGILTEIGNYISSFNFFNSEISGNIIDLCPVGALTSNPSAFKSRPWDLRVNESVDLTDSIGANIYIHFKESEIFRILPKNNLLINDSIISDKSRFYYDCNSTNRINDVFSFTPSLKTYEISKWLSFFKELDYGLESRKSFSVIYNDTIDFWCLSLIRKISFFYKNVYSFILNHYIIYTNLYIFRLSNLISDINTLESICIILMLNPKVECSLINYKLRTQSRNSLLSFYSLGQYMESNLSSNYIFLDLISIIKIFEGKNEFYSDIFISSYKPSLIFGDSIISKFSGIIDLMMFLKKVNNSFIFFRVGLNCNSEGVRFLNSKNLSRQSLDNSHFLMGIDIDDTFFTRKYLNISNKILLWLNSHGSKFALNSKMILPVLTEFEDEKVVMNLEHRPQKTERIFKGFSNVYSIKDALMSGFDVSKFCLSYKEKHINFINEFISSSYLFENFVFKFTSYVGQEFYCKNYISFWYISDSINKLPIEDFYLSIKSGKNSLNMAKASYSLYNHSKNFFNL